MCRAASRTARSYVLSCKPQVWLGLRPALNLERTVAVKQDLPEPRQVSRIRVQVLSGGWLSTR
jgi:hypothetical protein